MNRAILNTGAAHNAAGPNLSRSTNRSAAGKSEKDNKHQQPEQDVSHDRRPSPCAHCEQNHTDKQAKNVPAGGMRRRSGYRVSGLGSRKKIKKERRDFPRSFFNRSFLSISLYPIPYTLYPSPYLSRMAIASISISASGLTSAFTTTPVAAGNPFLKYFLRTAAVSLYLSRVVT